MFEEFCNQPIPPSQLVQIGGTFVGTRKIKLVCRKGRLRVMRVGETRLEELRDLAYGQMW